MNSEINNLEQRVSKVEARMDGFEKRMDDHASAHERLMRDLNEKFDKIYELLQERLPVRKSDSGS